MQESFTLSICNQKVKAHHTPALLQTSAVSTSRRRRSRCREREIHRSWRWLFFSPPFRGAASGAVTHHLCTQHKLQIIDWNPPLKDVRASCSTGISRHPFPYPTVVQPSLVASQRSGLLYLEQGFSGGGGEEGYKPRADCSGDSLTRIEVYAALKKKKNRGDDRVENRRQLVMEVKSPSILALWIKRH